MTALRNLLPVLLSFGLAAPAFSDDSFTKIFVDRDGVVRVSDAALRQAGKALSGEDLARIQLSLKGRPVPLRIVPASAGEGAFAFEFLGAFPRGAETWEDPYTTQSVYVLGTAAPGKRPVRVEEFRADRVSGPGRLASPFTAHHEVNRKLIRFTGEKLPPESWFWQEIKATDTEPTRLPIAVERVQPGRPFTLRVKMMGYSHMPQNPDHTVDVGWNGRVVGKAVWDGEAPYLFETTLDGTALKEGQNSLTLHATGEKTDGIDLVLLDWVEVAYERRHDLGSTGQTLVSTEASKPARIVGVPRGDSSAWSADGARVMRLADRAGEALLGGVDGTWRVVKSGGCFPPHGIVVSRPLDLKGAGQGADFIIISHERFLRAARRLAEVRRSEGLATSVVPVDDVYDRFSDGFFQPDAIREFLRFAWKSWSPRPRYVLLIGDASWDYKNATVSQDDYADWHWSPEWARSVPKNSPYLIASDRNDRQFIPTHQYQSPWGHAADDNWFAVLNEDPQQHPDVAIGRLPVVTAAEADDAVTKIIDYGNLPPASRRQALFITNDEEGFQRQTDTLAELARNSGYEILKVYPRKEERDNVANARSIIRDFDEGPAFVLFNGHGGRYIWRTGPADLAKNTDLFTLDDLDRLAETKTLPVVVSLTCYSAPFDHPVADSIGEKMLRMPHKGAIAVIASSWRNAPPLELGRKLLELLGAPSHPRIGDAYLDAKRGIGDPVAISTYNLLGDPTTPYRGPVPTTAAAPAKGTADGPSAH